MNRMLIDACMLQKAPLRHNLTGVAVVDVLIAHTSEQLEQGSYRQVHYEIEGLGMGEVAHVLNACELGVYYRMEGFLNRKSLRSAKLRFHITQVSALN